MNVIQLLGESGNIYDCDWIDPNHFITVSDDSTVKIWNLSKKSIVYQMKLEDDVLLRVTCFNDMIAIGNSEGKIYIYEYGKMETPYLVVDHKDEQEIYFMTFLESKVLLTGGDNRMRIIDIENNTQTNIYEWKFKHQTDITPYGGKFRNPGGKCFVLDACVHLDKSFVAVGLSDGTIRIVNIMNKRKDEVKLLRAHDSPVSGCAFSNDGRLLASVSTTGMKTIWETRTWGKVVDNVQCHERGAFGCTFIDFSLITWGSDGYLNFFDVNNFSNGISARINLKYPVYNVSCCHISRLTTGGTGGGNNDTITDKSALKVLIGVVGAEAPPQPASCSNGSWSCGVGSSCGDTLCKPADGKENRSLKQIPAYIMEIQKDSLGF